MQGKSFKGKLGEQGSDSRSSSKLQARRCARLQMGMRFKLRKCKFKDQDQDAIQERKEQERKIREDYHQLELEFPLEIKFILKVPSTWRLHEVQDQVYKYHQAQIMAIRKFLRMKMEKFKKMKQFVNMLL